MAGKVKNRIIGSGDRESAHLLARRASRYLGSSDMGRLTLQILIYTRIHLQYRVFLLRAV